MVDQATEYVDNELVRRAAKGDLDAFEDLFRRHQKRVYNISLRMLSDESEAADATQEVFVRAFRSIAKLKSEAAFVSWLKTLTVNYCRDVLRRRMRTGIVESLDKPRDTGNGTPMRRDLEDWSSNPERVLARKDVSETVQKAISSLVPQYREVVALFYVDGAEVAEIAKILRCPVGTVKSRLARARGELKRKLAHLVES